MLLDLRRREEDDPFEVKISEEKKKKLRRGGARADHRVGAPPVPSLFFFSDRSCLERGESFSL